MKMKDGFEKVSSDHIDAVRYDPIGHQMQVLFRNGSKYLVHGVMPHEHAAFMAAPSKGSFYHHNIKNNFHIEQLS